jgi:hypothetical protein
MRRDVHNFVCDSSKASPKPSKETRGSNGSPMQAPVQPLHQQQRRPSDGSLRQQRLSKLAAAWKLLESQWSCSEL